jgi:hypothetical protein
MSIKLVYPSSSSWHFLVLKTRFIIPRGFARSLSEAWRVAHRSTFWRRTMKSRTEKMKKSKSDSKNSWVMLAESGDGGYTPLPGEQTLYQSPTRTTLSLQTTNTQSSHEAYSQHCKSGVVYLTNRRVGLYTTSHPTSSPTKLSLT